MTPLRRVSTAVAALALAATWVVAGAGAAGAQDAPRKVVFDSPPTGATPPEGQVVTADKPTIDVYVPFGLSNLFRDQRIDLVAKSGNRPPITLSRTVSVGETCQRVTFADLPLRFNGPYDLTVLTPGVGDPIVAPGGSCANAVSSPRRFYMGVRPATPGGVKAEMRPPLQSPFVSWTPSPEPDVIRYRVLRAKGPDGKFQPAGETARPSFTDVATAEGGDFTYKVVAIRNGSGKPGADRFVESEPSGPSGKVTVAAVAPPSSSAPTFAGPRSPGRAPLSPPPKPRYITPGETGFSETLPFGGGPQVTEEPGDLAADAPQVELGSNEPQSDTKRSLALLAAGLLATVLAMHLLWVKGEVDREPLEVLSPE